MEAVAFFCVLLITGIHSKCDPAIDLNTATLSELKSLRYVSRGDAKLIMDIRPICSPLELTYSPKKIVGITENRLNNNWNWFKDKLCTETCCLADAWCPDTPDSSQEKDAIYSWQTGSWSDCTSECGKGTQHRDVRCTDSINIVGDRYCLTLNYKPISKRLCNTHSCPIYEWIALQWQRCVLSDSNGICSKKRDVLCYDIRKDRISDDSKCDVEDKPDIIASCDSCTRLRSSPLSSLRGRSSSRSLLSSKSTEIGDHHVTVNYDLSNYNNCNTNLYRDIPDDKTLIVRRGCYMDIWVDITGQTDDVNLDISWFYLDATLQANTAEIDNNEWYSNYLEWWPHPDNKIMGWITINIPDDAYIGEFLCNLYYQHNGDEANRQKIADFILYVLFNPYNSNDAVYISSIVDRREYVENELGLIWQGSSDSNSATTWNYDQFYFPNLEISMNVLDRLELQYRKNLVLISRQISYVVAKYICYGKWGSGSYTTGRPSGGYECSSLRRQNNCIKPWEWSGTTQLFNVYRDKLNYEYKVQYCQCWVYAGVSTTIGRALGIPTRSITNFQSAHDSDYNRAIEKYWIFDGEYYSSVSGQSDDSVWNFHAWNEMYFKRDDFTDDAYNNFGWQAVDATPQEYSYGGNPALSSDLVGAYQMGPASIALVKDNKNPHQCRDASSVTNKARFGCFDTEFVISETNANYNFWSKLSTDPVNTKYTLLYVFEEDPWDTEYGTIGVLTNTKRPGTSISPDCLNENIGDCDDEYLDLTLDYKYNEPSDPGTPTDTEYHYQIGEKRWRRRRRRRLWGENKYSLDDLDVEGIEYDVITIPNKWYMTPMIIGDDTDNIIDLYGDDYTFGMMSINMDSYHDNAFDVYCGFMVTAHDYSGKQLYLNDDNTTNGLVKNEKFHFVLNSGESNSCRFYTNYSEYSQWINEIPFAFKFIISVSLFDKKSNEKEEPYQIIMEERDFLVCSPKSLLRDRIICHHKSRWIQPSFNLQYECNADDGVDINSVGDGFCDEINNIDACYDGGDCCKSSCIPSKQYKCPKIFNCIDDRIKYQNKNYYKCPHISSFIKYMNNLRESSVCIDIATSLIANNFKCSPNIFTSDTGNQCVNHILSMDGVFGEIQSCFDESFKSLQTGIRQIIRKIIACINIQETSKQKDNKNRGKALVIPMNVDGVDDINNNDDDGLLTKYGVFNVLLFILLLNCIFIIIFKFGICKKGGNRYKKAANLDDEINDFSDTQSENEENENMI